MVAPLDLTNLVASGVRRKRKARLDGDRTLAPKSARKSEVPSQNVAAFFRVGNYRLSLAFVSCAFHISRRRDAAVF